MNPFYNIEYLVLRKYIGEKLNPYIGKTTGWTKRACAIEGIDILLSGPRLDSIITITLTI